MSLIGMATLVVAGLGVLLCSVGLLMAWDRLAALGRARWPVRALWLGCCQLTAVLLVGLVVNHAFVFYQSWSELFGLHPQVDQGSAGAGTRDVALQPALLHDYRTGHGTVVSLPVPGTVSGVHAAPATVYLPPQYGAPGYADRSFPVVELLSGFPGGPRTWMHVLHVAGVLDTLIDTGRAAPFIAVIPVQNVASPRDTECVDVVHGPQVEDYLTSDVRTAVLSAFRASPAGSQWTVMGDSTGGYCALNLSLRHPDLFGAAVSIAGYDAAAHDHTTGDLFGGSAVLAHQNSPLWRLQHDPVPALRVLLISTRPDRTAYRASVRLEQAARPPLQLWQLTLPTGGHNFTTFSAEIPVGFSWLSRQVATPLAPLPTVAGLGPQPVTPAAGEPSPVRPVQHASEPVRISAAVVPSRTHR
ncbi:alpha/beta hydrolase [Jatrophihabitans sp.]|uniref:alpha/beta hydrolase n=1 Tax=Jatrophihabitans sp. TaxID=1932789 RepID=UPI002BBD9743|nr:alpha/beta hydrolase-fold protein [Jatrophihabitans sp.]